MLSILLGTTSAAVLASVSPAHTSQSQEDPFRAAWRADDATRGVLWAVPARAFAVSPDDQSVIVAEEEGTLRTHALPGGEELASSAAQAGDPRVSVRRIGDRVLAIGSKRLTVHDATSLAVLCFEELEKPHHFWAASDAGDAFVTGRRHGEGRLHRLEESDGKWTLTSVPIQEFASLVQVAFSPDGRQLAAATTAGVSVLDSRTLKSVWGPSPRVPRTIQCVAFFGNDQLAVGWGDQSGMEQPGVDVFSLEPEGGQVRLATSVVLPFGGAATAIHCDPELSLLTFSVSAAGVIAGFRYEDGKWGEAWAADYMGGNPGSLIVERCAGSDLAFVWGMNTSVVDLKTGAILRRAQLSGMRPIDGALEGKVIVGLRRGSLVVQQN